MELKTIPKQSPSFSLENYKERETIDCIPMETEIKNVKLAQAYVPIQIYCTTNIPLESLIKGTAFPELYFPYMQQPRIMEDIIYE
jgi:hypothetical protein